MYPPNPVRKAFKLRQILAPSRCRKKCTRLQLDRSWTREFHAGDYFGEVQIMAKEKDYLGETVVVEEAKVRTVV